MDEKFYKLLKGLFDKKIKGADVYTHSGSIWVIFTNEKSWVIELTKEGQLWYRYSFFQDIFKLFSQNVIDNQIYITRYVEDAIQNGVKHTCKVTNSIHRLVEDAIQNGVKNTTWQIGTTTATIEDAIQNGVKHTDWDKCSWDENVEDVIQNGVKNTSPGTNVGELFDDDNIQNGVKHTEHIFTKFIRVIKDTIQYWSTNHHVFYEDAIDYIVKDTIKNGVKNTTASDNIIPNIVENTIQNGVKLK